MTDNDLAHYNSALEGIEAWADWAQRKLAERKQIAQEAQKNGQFHDKHQESARN